MRTIDRNGLSKLREHAGGAATFFLRGGAGLHAMVRRPLDERPDLVLYEVEGCPYSRLAREALAMLDLDALVMPCPRGASRSRSALLEARGEETVPFLLDRTRGAQVGEADAIVDYLFEHYAEVAPPRRLRSALAVPTSRACSALIGMSGEDSARTQPIREHAPLELWAFEACPYCRRVRRELCALALPYVSHSCARGGALRPAFQAKHGRTQFPYLEDPATGVALFESEAICEYLQERYGLEAQTVDEAGRGSFPASDPPSWTPH